jgi:Fe-S-cluster containining protein
MLDFVPWRYIADWKCIRCGDCCRLYSVVINFHEWLRIVKNYGIEHTTSGLDKLYIRRRSDGACTFLGSSPYASMCALQSAKPRACQLWPFKVLMKPQYGFAREATFPIGENYVFVYADTMCNGLMLGSPTLDFANYTVREFVEIAAGLSSQQLKTTSNISLRPVREF